MQRCTLRTIYAFYDGRNLKQWLKSATKYVSIQMLLRFYEWRDNYVDISAVPKEKPREEFEHFVGFSSVVDDRMYNIIFFSHKRKVPHGVCAKF